MQIQGGMGFTWEYPALSRTDGAGSAKLMLGDPAYHRELLIQCMDL